MKVVFFLIGFMGASVFSLQTVSADEKEEIADNLKKAQACMQEEDYECAVEGLHRVLEKRPDMAQVRNLLGLAYSKQDGFIQSAIAEFEEAAALDPHYAEPYFNLGTLHASALQDAEAALDYFEKALQIDPSYARATFAMSWIYLFEKKDLEKALSLFKSSAESMPKLAEAYYGIALCYLQLNKRELVLEPISRMRELNREDLAAKIESFMQTGDLNRLAKTAPGGTAPPGAPGGPSPAGGPPGGQNTTSAPAPTPAPAG